MLKHLCPDCKHHEVKPDEPRCFACEARHAYTGPTAREPITDGDSHE